MTDLQISTTRRQATFRISARTRNARIVYYPAPDLAISQKCDVSLMFPSMDLSDLAWQQTYTGRIRMTTHDALNCTDYIGMEIRESNTFELGHKTI
jgi:hypothetical protein